MIELKPCPFCGGEADLIETSNLGSWGVSVSFVRCSVCWIDGESGNNIIRKKANNIAIKAWNTRAKGEKE